MKKHAIHMSEKGFSMRAVVCLIVSLIMVGAVSDMYVWQHRKVDDQRSTISNLQLQIEKLQGESTATKSTPNNPPSQSTKTDTNHTYSSKNGTKVMVYFPNANSKISSPQPVIGEVPGYWSFEASFPVLLIDSQGTEIARGAAEVLGNWMTDQLVPFSVKLAYDSTPTGDGSLVLQKDNPSGMQQYDDSITIPVHF